MDYNLFRRKNLISFAKHKGFVIFESNSNKEYNLNIWGIRSDEQHAGKFDDKLIIFYGKDAIEIFDVTVDPSDLNLINPINRKGTAIIYPGQYRGVWQLGFHKGRTNHPALVQRRPITVIRDSNKNIKLDFNKPIYSHYNRYISSDKSIVTDYYDFSNNIIFKLNTGFFGINCHKASFWRILETIGLHSAGCVVHKNPTRYDKEFIPIIRNSVSQYGNSFSFTLITENELNLFLS